MNSATSQDSDKFALQFPRARLDQYVLRFPNGMRPALKESAKRSGRSLNAEIIHRLTISFGGDANITNEQLLQILAARLGRGE